MMTLSDLGYRGHRPAIAKAMWVIVAALVMWLFDWNELVIDRLGEIWSGILAFVAIFIFLFLWNFITAPTALLGEAETKVEELEEVLYSKERRQEAISRLWNLRKEGVVHRNQHLTKKNEFPVWEQGFEAWRQRTLDEAGKVSVNLQSWLDTLDRVREPPALPPAVCGEHHKLRRFMSEMLSRMEEFLEAEMLNRDIQHWNR